MPVAGFGIDTHSENDMVPIWIVFTLLAAFTQAWRNAFQKALSVDVDAAGVTLARFLWAWPVALAWLALLYVISPAPLPRFSVGFILDSVAAALAQILATILMVSLFKHRNYAVGVGLAKSEALMAGIIGVMFFGTTLTPLGWLGVVIGAGAIWLMKGTSAAGVPVMRTLLLGLGSGLCFALTTLWVRHAILRQPELPLLHASGWLLCMTITVQWWVLMIYMTLYRRHTLKALIIRPGRSLQISLTSLIASGGWFTALALQDAAIVKTLGQIEIIFMMGISWWWLRTPISRRDCWGLALIVAGALCVMWG